MPSRTPNVDLIAAVVFTKKTPKLTQSDVILAISGQQRYPRFDSIYFLCKIFFLRKPSGRYISCEAGWISTINFFSLRPNKFSSWAQYKYTYIFIYRMYLKLYNIWAESSRSNAYPDDQTSFQDGPSINIRIYKQNVCKLYNLCIIFELNLHDQLLILKMEITFFLE